MLTQLDDSSKEIAKNIDTLNHVLHGVSNTLEDSSEELARTMKKYSESADKQAHVMMWITGALAIFALAQVVIAALPYYDNRQEIGIRRSCFQSVLQTSNIDLNYKNCLRNHGLIE